jgi:hypothetical protein
MNFERYIKPYNEKNGSADGNHQEEAIEYTSAK